MAVSRVGAWSESGKDPTSGTLTLPSGCAAGDLAIVWWYTAANSKVPSMSGPTQLYNNQYYGYAYAGGKVLDSTDISNGDCGSWTANSVGNATTGCIVVVYTGVDTSFGLGGVTGVGALDFGTGTQVTHSGVQVSLGGSASVAMFGMQNDNTLITAPNYYTYDGNATWSNTSGTDASACVADRVSGVAAPPNTETPGDWYTTNTSGWMSLVLILAPVDVVSPSLVYASSNFGEIESVAGTYSAARAGTGTLNVDTTSNSVALGQTTNYSCFEVFLEFDTSIIGAGQAVDVATLSIYDSSIYGSGFDEEVRVYDYGDAVTSADFVAGADLSSCSLFASIDVDAIVSGRNDRTTVDASVIEMESATRFVMCSSDQTDGTSPDVSTDLGYLFTSAYTGTTHDPYLYIEWSESSTTQVAQTRSMSYRVKNVVGPSRSTSYRIKSLTAQTRSLSYKVHSSTPAAQTRSLSYRVRDLVAQTRGLSYQVRNTVAQTRALSYAIREPVSAVREFSYRITTPVSTTRGFSYRIHAPPVGATRSLSYNIRAAVAQTRSASWRICSAVAQTRSASWQVRNLVADAQALSYRVRVLAASTRSASWRIRNVVAQTRSMEWAIEGTVVNVAQTLSLSYQVINHVSATKGLSYAIREPVAQTRSLSYRVRDVVAQTRSLSYRVGNTVAQTRSLSYAIHEPVAQTRGLSYRIRTTVAQTRGMEWAIEQSAGAVSSSLSLSYRIRNAVGPARSLSYRIRVTVDNTRSLSYRIKSAVGREQALSYVVRNAVGPAREFSYRIKSQVAISRSLSYRIASSVAQTRSFSYKVRNNVARSASMSYKVFVLVAQTRSMEWQIDQTTGRVGSDLSFSYNIANCVASARSTSYTIHGTVAQTRALSYHIHEPVAQTRSLSYRVHLATPPGAELALSYRIVMHVDASLGLLYRLGVVVEGIGNHFPFSIIVPATSVPHAVGSRLRMEYMVRSGRKRVGRSLRISYHLKDYQLDHPAYLFALAELDPELARVVAAQRQSLWRT